MLTHDFNMELENGYDFCRRARVNFQVVKEVSIARAFHKISILILDETSSSLTMR